MPHDVDTLRELFDARIQALSVAITAVERTASQAQASSDKANDKAEKNNDARWANGNEWRASLNDVISRFPTREEINAQFAVLTAKIDTNASRVDRIEARGLGLNAGWGYLVGVVGVAAAVLANLRR